MTERAAIAVNLTEENVQKKTDSEKLSALVQIAFATHEQVVKQGLTLYGNGDPQKGLCYKVGSQGTRLSWLIGILSAVGVAALGGLAVYVVR
jgi:hypothetical protein